MGGHYTIPTLAPSRVLYIAVNMNSNVLVDVLGCEDVGRYYKIMGRSSTGEAVHMYTSTYYIY